MRQQLQELTEPGFLTRTPWNWLQQYPRYLDVIRRRKPVTPLFETAGEARGADPVAQATENEIETLLRAEIENLPPTQRATLLLRADQGLSYDEIAYVLGSNRNAVRMNLVAARKRLAEKLRGIVDLGGEAGR